MNYTPAQDNCCWVLHACCCAAVGDPRLVLLLLLAVAVEVGVGVEVVA